MPAGYYFSNLFFWCLNMHINIKEKHIGVPSWMSCRSYERTQDWNCTVNSLLFLISRVETSTMSLWPASTSCFLLPSYRKHFYVCTNSLSATQQLFTQSCSFQKRELDNINSCSEPHNPNNPDYSVPYSSTEYLEQWLQGQEKIKTVAF